jgi:hypothetical protein
MSMGSSEASSSSLRVAIEAWTVNSGNGEPTPSDPIEGDRYRGGRRGSENLDESGLMDYEGYSGRRAESLSNVVVIPEPSSTLLIGLGSLRLLVRRRRTS